MKVLHIPFQFVPGQLGGTEIYVETLCRHLVVLGIHCAIATPASRQGVAEKLIDGITVFEFGQDPSSGFEQAYGRPDWVAAANFRLVLQNWRPDAVHLHAHTAAVSEVLVDEAERAGARVLFTYHTPTVSCARGTMMYMGRTPCDGVLEVTRCTACLLQKHGLKNGLASIFSRTPDWLGRLLAQLGLHGGVWTALRMRGLVTSGQRRFHDLMRRADRVVAVCDWVANVLRRNSITEPQLVISRQGLPYAQIESMENGNIGSAAKGADASIRPPLLLRYFGRLERNKGLDVLLSALATIPTANVSLEIFAIIQGAEDEYRQRLRGMIEQDKRVALRRSLPSSAVVAAMRAGDLVVVPSQSLETGPLVILEAFAAGKPVLGSRLGGIAELVTDGVDGLLVEAKNENAWANAIQGLEADRRALKRLVAGIKPPRTMKQVAREMSELYESLG
ncbi:MAG: glycosyltransferase [Proteobacteria bacterium]|nr:glycosyltransferase [Pseudomonadota bacterium]